MPTPAAPSPGRSGSPATDWRDGFGADFHDRLSRTFGRYTEWGITTEDLPDDQQL